MGAPALSIAAALNVARAGNTTRRARVPAPVVVGVEVLDRRVVPHKPEGRHFLRNVVPVTMQSKVQVRGRKHLLKWRGVRHTEAR